MGQEMHVGLVGNGLAKRARTTYVYIALDNAMGAIIFIFGKEDGEEYSAPPPSR